MNIVGIPVHLFEHDGGAPTAAFIVKAPPWDAEKNEPKAGGYAQVATFQGPGMGLTVSRENPKWRGDKTRNLAESAKSWDFVPWLDPRETRDLDTIAARVLTEAKQQNEVLIKRIKVLELNFGKLKAQIGRALGDPEVDEPDSEVAEPVGVSADA